MSQPSSSFIDRFWPLVKYTDLRPQFLDRIATGPSLRACISVQRRQLTIWQGAQLVDKLDLSAAARDRNASVRARGNAIAFRAAGPDGGGSQSTAPFKHFRVRLATFQERTSLCSALAQFVPVEESPGTALQFSQESPVLATTPPLTQWQSSATPIKREITMDWTGDAEKESRREITAEWARQAEKESRRGNTAWMRDTEKESGYSQQWKPPLLQQATEPEEEKAYPLHKLPPPAYRTPKRPGEVLSPQDLSTPEKKMKLCEQHDSANLLQLLPTTCDTESGGLELATHPADSAKQLACLLSLSPQNSNQNQNQNAWQDHHSPMVEEEDVRDDFSDCYSASELSSQCSDYGGSIDSTFSSQLSSSSQMEAISKEEFFDSTSSSPSSQQSPATSMLSAVPKECYYSDSDSQQQEEEKPFLLEPRTTMVSQATQTDPEDALGELEVLQAGELSEYMGEMTEHPGFARLLATLSRLINNDGALAQRMELAMRRMEMGEERDDDEEEEMLADTPPPLSPERREEEEEGEDESAMRGWE